ncbi:MAG: cation:proton antiporter [Maritimibacter sp.]|nr:cation:proton antiporter [Maritimibacter sp.]
MTGFLLLAFIFLVAGVVSVPLASKLGLGSVLGYLIAGIIIGPLLALLHVDVVQIQHFAEFGVVMMLFLVGLELEPKRLWAMRHKLIGLGGMQIGLTALAVAVVAVLMGEKPTVALAVGLVLALSSTAIVLQTLQEKGQMRSDGGSSAFAVLLTQDIAVIPMLALIPLMALPELAEAVSHGAGEDGHDAGLSLVAGLSGWQTTLVTLGAIGLVVVAGSTLTGPIFRFIGHARLRELFVAGALMIVVGIAVLMSLVGLSAALGTFIAGVVLANSEYRHELESDIEPFKGLLLGLFFITVGAGIDFTLLAENAAAIVGLTLGLMALKAGVLLVLARIFGLRGHDKWLFALSLAQAGEFGFVLLSFTVGAAVIPEALADRLMLVVALSMLLTPLLFILLDRVIAPRFAGGDAREADEIVTKGSVIIAGHGRVGGIVNRILRAMGTETTVIDYSSSQLDMLRTFGVHAHYGDATRPDLLVAAGIEEAKVFVIAIDGKEQITELARYAVKTWPHLHVIARAVDRTHVYDLWSVGCRDIVRETYDSSLRLGRSAIEALGHGRDDAQNFVDAFNDFDRKAMVEVASVYDINIPGPENPEYVAKVREISEAWGEQLRGHLGPAKSGESEN